jgi:2-oxoglutarate ferredoxin oxidoreductase subunit gamma
MQNYNITVAGFGGQGVLFTGTLLANIGMIMGKEASWLPSYGPEMRSGSCNCGIVISDAKIGSPVVFNPNLLVVLSPPALAKFEPRMEKGGLMFYESTLIPTKPTRSDVTLIDIPAARLANEAGLDGYANALIVGHVMKKTGICDMDIGKRAIEKTISERRAADIDKNIKAMEIGFGYLR